MKKFSCLNLILTAAAALTIAAPNVVGTLSSFATNVYGAGPAPVLCNASDHQTLACSQEAGITTICTELYLIYSSDQPVKDELAQWGWRCLDPGCSNIRIAVIKEGGCTTVFPPVN